MMQTLVPTGRANYEPNSLAERARTAARANARDRFRQRRGNDERNDGATSCACAPSSSPTITARRGCSSARRPTIEQAHIASALVFELSKVGLDHVRKRVLSQSAQRRRELAKRVADGLAMALPAKATAAREPVDMEPSPALSIVKNAKETLEGRKVGILFAEGSDQAEIEQVKKAANRRGQRRWLIAPKIGG